MSCSALASKLTGEGFGMARFECLDMTLVTVFECNSIDAEIRIGTFHFEFSLSFEDGGHVYR